MTLRVCRCCGEKHERYYVTHLYADREAVLHALATNDTSAGVECVYCEACARSPEQMAKLEAFRPKKTRLKQ